jgi:hypothetical protein
MRALLLSMVWLVAYPALAQDKLIGDSDRGVHRNCRPRQAMPPSYTVPPPCFTAEGSSASTASAILRSGGPCTAQGTKARSSPSALFRLGS